MVERQRHKKVISLSSIEQGLPVHNIVTSLVAAILSPVRAVVGPIAMCTVSVPWIRRLVQLPLTAKVLVGFVVDEVALGQGFLLSVSFHHGSILIYHLGDE
jgi:hypothetical protein